VVKIVERIGDWIDEKIDDWIDDWIDERIGDWIDERIDDWIAICTSAAWSIADGGVTVYMTLVAHWRTARGIRSTNRAHHVSAHRPQGLHTEAEPINGTGIYQ
jgi:hypothetical protein